MPRCAEKRYVWCKARRTVAVLGVAFVFNYCALTSVAESPVLEAVPPGDEIQWATVAIHGFSGHECGQVVEASRLPDGSIRAKCGGEWFRVAFTNGAPVAIKCPAALIDDDWCTAARNVKPVPGHGGQ
jgi:hypothetical protein